MKSSFEFRNFIHFCEFTRFYLLFTLFLMRIVLLEFWITKISRLSESVECHKIQLDQKHPCWVWRASPKSNKYQQWAIELLYIGDMWKSNVLSFTSHWYTCHHLIHILRCALGMSNYKFKLKQLDENKRSRIVLISIQERMSKTASAINRSSLINLFAVFVSNRTTNSELWKCCIKSNHHH